MHATNNETETDAERIARWNDTAHPFPEHATLHGIIEEQLAARGDDVAVICEHDKTFGTPTLTCAQLNAKANQLAHLLRSHGVGPDSIVGLLVERAPPVARRLRLFYR